MTIPSEVNRSGPYNGNGVTTAFEYQFKIYEPEHLRVILIDTDGGETVLVHEQDYTVTGVADDAGGNAVLTHAPANGQKIVLLRGVPFTQDTDLENQGAYYAETVEVRMDLLTMQIQQLKEQTDRSILADYGQSGLKITNNLDEGDTLMMVGGLLGKGPNSGMIVNAAGYATEASAARSAAQGYAQNAETSALETVNFAAAASQWSATAQDWAVKMDGVVDGTDHSAKYWATQAYLNGGVPIGTIIDVYGNGTTTPPGYLKIIPGLEITTAHPELRSWALVNGWSVNGAGNPVFPSTDDALFKRQWRAGQTLRDAGRAFGSVQADAFQGHKHGVSAANIGNTAGGAQFSAASAAPGTPTTDPVSDGINGVPRTATETRVANITVTWFIKAYSVPLDAATVSSLQVLNDLTDARSRLGIVEVKQGWEVIEDTGDLSDVSGYIKTNLGAYRWLRLTVSMRVSVSNGTPLLHLSSDNGASWIVSSYHINGTGLVGSSAYNSQTANFGAIAPTYVNLSNQYDTVFNGILSEFNMARSGSKYYLGSSRGVNANGGFYYTLTVGGSLEQSTDAMNAFRLVMSSGTFSGRIFLEGTRG